jgi:hypothetical protein
LPALQRQAQLLLESLAAAPGLHPDDLAELRAISGGDTDPADHTRGRR